MRWLGGLGPGWDLQPELLLCGAWKAGGRWGRWLRPLLLPATAQGPPRLCRAASSPTLRCTLWRPPPAAPPARLSRRRPALLPRPPTRSPPLPPAAAPAVPPQLPPQVCSWFAARCDLILLLFDPYKLDISDEFKSVGF